MYGNHLEVTFVIASECSRAQVAKKTRRKHNACDATLELLGIVYASRDDTPRAIVYVSVWEVWLIIHQNPGLWDCEGIQGTTEGCWKFLGRYHHRFYSALTGFKQRARLSADDQAGHCPPHHLVIPHFACLTSSDLRAPRALVPPHSPQPSTTSPLTTFSKYGQARASRTAPACALDAAPRQRSRW